MSKFDRLRHGLFGVSFVLSSTALAEEARASEPKAPQDNVQKSSEPADVITSTLLALQSLSQATQAPGDDVRQRLNEIVEQSVDIPAVTRFVLGRYFRRVDDKDFDDIARAYQWLVVTTLKSELVSGNNLKFLVGDSHFRGKNQAIVETKIYWRRQELSLNWRVRNDGNTWRVIDIALEVEGNLIWFAIEQRSQANAILERNSGRMTALIAALSELS